MPEVKELKSTPPLLTLQHLTQPHERDHSCLFSPKRWAVSSVVSLELEISIVFIIILEKGQFTSIFLPYQQ